MNQSINPDFKPIQRKLLSIEEYVQGIRKSDRVILSQAITLIESSKPDHQAMARNLVSACLPYIGKSLRVGITGVPGVGKSSFIEASGIRLIEKYSKKLAVLAIDPSSRRQGGSILGDKTRMEKLSNHPNAFIRPSPAAGSLGGVARKTRETILLCEAAGYELILIETVGVGQSEVTVYDMVDCFVLLMLSGAGDQLQGIKRGIMEMSDFVAITKADAENEARAKNARSEYDLAVRMLPLADHGLRRSVLTCSAHLGTGLENIWKQVFDFAKKIERSGYKNKNRSNQMIHWMKESLENEIMQSLYSNRKIKNKMDEYILKVQNNKLSPFDAAHELFEMYIQQSL